MEASSGKPGVESRGSSLGATSVSLAGPAGFGTLAILLTWPWAHELWRGSVGGDAAQFVWDAWWVQERVFALENPWRTELLYAPEGTYLAAHPLETLLMALASPLTALAGPMVTYGLLVLVTLTAAGLFAWRLGLALGLGHVGAVVVGVLWMSAPIVVFRAPSGLYMLLLLAALLPAALLLAHRLLRTVALREAVWLGVFLGACLLTDLQVTTYLLLALAAVGLYAVVTRPVWRTRAALARAAVVVGLCFAIGLPVLLMIARSELDGSYRTPTGARVASATAYSADLAQFALPSPASRFFGDVYAGAADRFDGLAAVTVDSAVTLGWAATALAVVGIVATRRSRRTWWLAGAVVVGAVLSLGPAFKVFGEVYRPLATDIGENVSLVAPATWLLGLPVVNDLRVPARYMQLGALAARPPRGPRGASPRRPGASRRPRAGRRALRARACRGCRRPPRAARDGRRARAPHPRRSPRRDRRRRAAFVAKRDRARRLLRALPESDGATDDPRQADRRRIHREAGSGDARPPPREAALPRAARPAG